MAERLTVAEQLDSATDKRVVTAHPAAIKNYLESECAKPWKMRRRPSVPN
jgi:hypothetical protein